METRGASQRVTNTTLDQDGVFNERLNRLRRSIASYRGYLTRLYKETDELMRNYDNHEEVIKKCEDLDKGFADFKEASDNCGRFLIKDEEKEAMASQLETEIRRYQEFKITYSDWLRKCTRRENRSSETGMQISPNKFEMQTISRDQTHEAELQTKDGGDSLHSLTRSDRMAGNETAKTTRERDNLYKDSSLRVPSLGRQKRSSNYSTQSSRSKNQGRRWFENESKKSSQSSERSKQSQKLAMSRLKLKQLEEKEELLERQQKLEAEICERKLKTEMAKLELKGEIIDARAEVEKCAIESQYSMDDGDFGRDVDERLPDLERQTLQQTMEKFLGSSWTEKQVEEFPTSSRSNPPPITSARNDGGIHPEIQRLLERQSQVIEGQNTTVEKLTFSLDLPKREFLCFDGNPTAYLRFIKNFEVNVESRVPDETVRLSYLIQYTSGAARQAIENCVIYPADVGYEKAKEILRKNFGQKHNIVRAFVQKVVRGPQIKSGETEKMMQLARDMRNCLMNSMQMNYKADINSLDTLMKVVKRLPSYLQAKWADVSGKLIQEEKEPEFEHLVDFVEKNAAIANTTFGKLVGSKPEGDIKPNPKVREPVLDPRRVSTFGTQHAETQTGGDSSNDHKSQQRSRQCLLCGISNHDLEKCYKFRQKTYQERLEFTRTEKLCHNCLRRNHFARRCRLGPACMLSGCNVRHHSLLHLPVNPPENSPSSEKDQEESPQRSNEAGNSEHCGAAAKKKPRVCLRILPVRIANNDGTRHVDTYAFIDNGSDTTLCTNSLVEKLHLKHKPTEFSLTTVNAQDKKRRGLEVELKVQALKGEGELQLDRVWSVDRLPISERSIPEVDDIGHWSHLNGIDFPELDDKEVSILIGSDVPEVHWTLEERRGGPKEPLAVRTVLGWTLFGPIGSGTCTEGNVNFVQIDHGEEITHQLERLYNSEFNDLPLNGDKPMSIEDRRALTIMEKSVRQVDGHYQISLPWRYSPPCLPDNKLLAEKRLQQLQRRLKYDEQLKQKYRNVIDDYVVKGHARIVPEAEIDSNDKPLWYLPHHPVLHAKKPGKVRVVFDCSAQYKGTSLNDQLLSGPDLTNSLVGVLLRFRQESIAMMSDVEQMFHQVLVDPKDQDAFRFLWWPKGDLKAKAEEFQMLVHLFGATSSPSCANFALRKTAEDNRKDFDLSVIETVNRNFYVDDCLKSVATIERALHLVKELPRLLERGGFNLTKWVSNRREVTTAIPVEKRASVVDLDLEKSRVDRALGVHWDIDNDTFGYKVGTREAVDTRRKILSLVSSIYDPLGIAAPLLLPAKKILQDLCRKLIGWDEIIPPELSVNWEKWIDNLPGLERLAVPRCLKPETLGRLSSIQLHYFADASEIGYGAVSYLRFVDVSGSIHCVLLMGKSRVAPLKLLTIPRLELSAATVTVKLHKLISYELELPIHDTVFWTDSTIVIQYIRNEARRFQTFTANRLALIHEISTPNQWRHVPSEWNPADSASRGLEMNDSKKLQQWLNGPSFLWTMAESYS